MNYKEYGTENKNVIILLHGGGLSWWNYREAAEILQKNYHVVIPVLDGHAGSHKDFVSIEENAIEIMEKLQSGATLEEYTYIVTIKCNGYTSSREDAAGNKLEGKLFKS